MLFYGKCKRFTLESFSNILIASFFRCIISAGWKVVLSPINRSSCTREVFYKKNHDKRRHAQEWETGDNKSSILHVHEITCTLVNLQPVRHTSEKDKQLNTENIFSQSKYSSYRMSQRKSKYLIHRVFERCADLLCRVFWEIWFRFFLHWGYPQNSTYFIFLENGTYLLYELPPLKKGDVSYIQGVPIKVYIFFRILQL